MTYSKVKLKTEDYKAFPLHSQQDLSILLRKALL